MKDGRPGVSILSLSLDMSDLICFGVREVSLGQTLWRITSGLKTLFGFDMKNSRTANSIFCR